MTDNPQTPLPPRSARRPSATTMGLWLIGIGLIANAVIMLAKPRFPDEITFDQKAYAQAAGGNAPVFNTRGIYMMPAQLGVNAWGVYVFDFDSSSIVCYRAIPESNRFKLMSVRNTTYDRQLEDFNNDNPTPKDVKRLIELQRQRVELNAPDTAPATVPATTPLPDEK